jgi:site-specific DNA-methyltransferase (adenine-specific)
VETKNIIVHGRSRDSIPKIRTPINCVITDPPFGIDVQMNSAVMPTSRAVNKKIANDNNPKTAIEIFYQEMGPILAKLDQQADIYVFTAWNVLDWWMPAVKKLSYLREDGTLDTLSEPRWDISLKMMLIWDKGYPGKGDLEANWGCGYEPILYLKKGRRPNPYRRSGIIHVDKVPAGQNIHPTEKPVQLLEILMEMSTIEGEFVVDPFSGSGSTSVAAKRLGRNSLAFDVDEQWIAPSRARLEQLGLF